MGVVAIPPVGGFEQPDIPRDGRPPGMRTSEGGLDAPKGFHQDLPVRAEVMPDGENDHEMAQARIGRKAGTEGCQCLQALAHQIGGADGAELEPFAVPEPAHVASLVSPGMDGDFPRPRHECRAALGHAACGICFPHTNEGIHQRGMCHGTPPGDLLPMGRLARGRRGKEGSG